MLRTVSIGVGVMLLASPAMSQTQSAPVVAEAAAQEQIHDKVLVVGQRPGPGLWKVSKGGNVLWVFGTHAPLPAKMQWRSQQVEAILAQSQEYLAPPSAGATVGLWRGLTLLPHLIGFKKNPGGAMLRDVVPADVYARWLVLKAKYGIKDDVESERPFFVADTLYRAGLQHAGLSTSDEVMRAIGQLVIKSKIKVMHSNVRLEFDDPAATIKQLKKGAMDDVECFTKTVERMETDLDAMRVRANAWAKGDIDAIRKLSYADNGAACSKAMENTVAIQNAIAEQAPEKRMRKLWLEAAEKALATNASTFAVLRLKNILEGNDLIAALQEKGYTVEAPQ